MAIQICRDVDSLARDPYVAKEVANDIKASPAPLTKQRPKKTPKSKNESPAPATKKKTPAKSTAKKTKTTGKDVEPPTPIQGIASLSENVAVAVTPVATKGKTKAANTPKTGGESTKKATTTKKRSRADKEEEVEEEEEPAPKSNRKSQKTPKRTLVEETPPTTTRKSTRKL